MKYIRMKNKWSDDFEGSEIVKEVYQIYNVKKGDDMNLWAFNFEGFPYCITEDMIIAQSDTIEELCDEFILFDKEYPHDFYIDHYYEDILEVYEQEKRTRDLYGAIWTDKGLIYVAKVNEKGELELL